MNTDRPWVQIHRDRAVLGRAAADDIAAELRGLLAEQGTVRMIFAAAPSQRETLEALIGQGGIDWSRVTAFHMDEYLGLGPTAHQRFGNWLGREFFDHLPLGAVHLIDPQPGTDPATTIARYTQLLTVDPIDVVCLGVGVNGHLAFNDPPVADFNDRLPVKVVDLDEVCRQQQVDDLCFDTLLQVPRQAITLTVPLLMSARTMFAMVPGRAKAGAVRSTLLGRISTRCPSTILRTHPGCTLYLDNQSAAELSTAFAG